MMHLARDTDDSQIFGLDSSSQFKSPTAYRLDYHQAGPPQHSETTAVISCVQAIVELRSWYRADDARRAFCPSLVEQRPTFQTGSMIKSRRRHR